MTTQRQITGFELGDEFARVLAETTQSLVVVLDEAGVVLLFNEACERATGFSRDEVVGRDLGDIADPAGGSGGVPRGAGVHLESRGTRALRSGTGRRRTAVDD